MKNDGIERKRISFSEIGVSINKKVLLGAFSLITCLALTTICSFIPYIIEPSRILTSEFLTDELIVIAIIIASFVSVMFMGQASNSADNRSNLSRARAEFTKSIAKVHEIGIDAFRQWVKKVLQPSDVLEIKTRELSKIGISDITILDLDDAQLKSLIGNPGKFNLLDAKGNQTNESRYYKSITKEQFRAILRIKVGKYSKGFVSPEYYLYESNLRDSRTVSERSRSESKKKGSFLTMRVFGRISVSVITGIIFAALVRDLTKDANAAEAWGKFITRLWSMVSSSFMGYISGAQMNDIDAEYVTMRVQVHTRFIQDNGFVAMDEQEEAKEEFKKRVMEESVLQIEQRK